jgi:hypothetical protein
VGNYQPTAGAPVAKTEIRYPKTAATGADYAGELSANLVPKPAPVSGKVKPTTTQTFVPTVPVTSTTPAPKGAPVVQLIVGTDFQSVKVTKLPDSVTQSAVSADTKNVCA